MEEAVAYYRTSSATNVGGDKDTLRRQRNAVEGFAKATGFEVVDSFYDAAVSGDDDLETREGFSDLLDRIEANGVRVVLIESADRLARKMLVQEVGIVVLQKRGVRCLTASGMDLTDDADEFKVAMRQVAGAFSQLEKSRLVRKLRSGREKRRLEKGRCEGRLPLELTAPEMVKEARRLHRKNPHTGKRRSLRKISEELASMGHTRKDDDGRLTGKPYSAMTIRNVLARKRPIPKPPLAEGHSDDLTCAWDINEEGP
jgi:DNA invertase Pin-like site-specific DNA recombinase